MTEETELFCVIDQLDLEGKELTYSETEAIHERNGGDSFLMSRDSYRLGFLRGMQAEGTAQDFPPVSKNERRYQDELKSLSKNLYVIDRLGKKHGKQGLASAVSIEMASMLQSVCMLLIESFSQKEAVADDESARTE